MKCLWQFKRPDFQSKRIKRIILCAVALAVLLGTTQIAFGYWWSTMLWGKTNTSWPLYRVYVDYTTLQPTWTNALYNARMEWNNRGNSNFYFYYGSGSGHTIKAGATADPKWLGQTVTNPKMPGSGSTTKITDADVVMNSMIDWNKYDFQSVVTHELGHWLRLEDLIRDSEKSYTMYYALAPYNTSQRSLELDDINGIHRVYGKKP